LPIAEWTNLEAPHYHGAYAFALEHQWHGQDAAVSQFQRVLPAFGKLSSWRGEVMNVDHLLVHHRSRRNEAV
jgi:hypothetical protein